MAAKIRISEKQLLAFHKHRFLLGKAEQMAEDDDVEQNVWCHQANLSTYSCVVLTSH